MGQVEIRKDSSEISDNMTNIFNKSENGIYFNYRTEEEEIEKIKQNLGDKNQQLIVNKHFGIINISDYVKANFGTNNQVLSKDPLFFFYTNNERFKENFIKKQVKNLHSGNYLLYKKITKLQYKPNEINEHIKQNPNIVEDEENYIKLFNEYDYNNVNDRIERENMKKHNSIISDFLNNKFSKNRNIFVYPFESKNNFLNNYYNYYIETLASDLSITNVLDIFGSQFLKYQNKTILLLMEELINIVSRYFFQIVESCVDLYFTDNNDLLYKRGNIFSVLYANKKIQIENNILNDINDLVTKSGVFVINTENEHTENLKMEKNPRVQVAQLMTSSPKKQEIKKKLKKVKKVKI